MLEALEEGGHDWYAMKRSNQVELHPVWFGIYDDVVYHHGAGFRNSVSRADLSKAGFPTFFHRVAGKLVDTVLDGDRIGRIRERIHPQRIVSRRISREAAGLHDEVFQAIQEDRDFFRRFIPKR